MAAFSCLGEDEESDRTDEGDNDLYLDTGRGVGSRSYGMQDQSPYHGAGQADDDVADDAKSGSSHDPAGHHTGHQADDQPGDYVMPGNFGKRKKSRLTSVSMVNPTEDCALPEGSEDGVGQRQRPAPSVIAAMEDAMSAGCDWLTPVAVGQGGVLCGRRTGPPLFAGKIARRRSVFP